MYALCVGMLSALDYAVERQHHEIEECLRRAPKVASYDLGRSRYMTNMPSCSRTQVMCEILFAEGGGGGACVRACGCVCGCVCVGVYVDVCWTFFLLSPLIILWWFVLRLFLDLCAMTTTIGLIYICVSCCWYSPGVPPGVKSRAVRNEQSVRFFFTCIFTKYFNRYALLLSELACMHSLITPATVAFPSTICNLDDL